MASALLAAAVAACGGKEDPELPDFNRGGGNGDTDPTESVYPAHCDNVVVAHRCGAKEARELSGKSYPDNSLAALTYAQGLGCYAVEIDIYWTKDNNVIVHHGSSGMVNGLHPSKSTLAEIRAAGKLSNGEVIPTLEDFLIQTVGASNCTRLWIETKNITNTDLTDAEQETAILNGFNRAREIIAEKHGEHFVEFNGAGRTSVFSKMYPIAKAAGYGMSLPMILPGTTMQKNGWGWANVDISTAGLKTSTIDDYISRNIDVSLYNLDTEDQIKAWAIYKDQVKGLMTNYPSQLLKALK